MVDIKELPPEIVNDFFLEFCERVLENKRNGLPTAPEHVQMSKWLDQSAFFRAYIEGQVNLLHAGLVAPEQVIRGTLSVGYMLAYYGHQNTPVT